MLPLAALALSVSLAGAEVPLAWTAHRTVLLQARAPDGAAAPGVEVWLVRGGSEPVLSGSTDAEGRATVLVPVRPAAERQDFRVVVVGPGQVGVIVQRTLPREDVPLALSG